MEQSAGSALPASFKACATDTTNANSGSSPKTDRPEFSSFASVSSMNSVTEAVNTVTSTIGLGRLKSVRRRPKSFGGWKESVRNACRADDLGDLDEGYQLFKVRKKPLVGITWHKRKYRLKLDSLRITYDDGGKSKFVELENISDVRSGFSTDTFNDLEKRLAKEGNSSKNKFSDKVEGGVTPDHCFSLIFDPRAGQTSLDLVAETPKVASKWLKALTKIVQAIKAVEMQKEHECYLRSQFQTADKKSSGYLLIHEFAELLRYIIDLLKLSSKQNPIPLTLC